MIWMRVTAPLLQTAFDIRYFLCIAKTERSLFLVYSHASVYNFRTQNCYTFLKLCSKLMKLGSILLCYTSYVKPWMQKWSITRSNTFSNNDRKSSDKSGKSHCLFCLWPMYQIRKISSLISSLGHNNVLCWWHVESGTFGSDRKSLIWKCLFCGAVQLHSQLGHAQQNPMLCMIIHNTSLSVGNLMHF